MNAVKLSLAGVIGFAFAYVLLIGSLIFSDMNITIEKKFTVSETVAGNLITINCSVVSPIFLPLNKEVQQVVYGHGYHGSIGFDGRAVVTVQDRWNADMSNRYISGRYIMASGSSNFHGHRAPDNEIGRVIAAACLPSVNMTMF